MDILKLKMSQNVPYEVKWSKELGRYLIASRDIEPREIIIREEPLVTGPTDRGPKDIPVCLGCCGVMYDNPFNRCTHCHWPVCSEACEKVENVTNFTILMSINGYGRHIKYHSLKVCKFYECIKKIIMFSYSVFNLHMHSRYTVDCKIQMMFSLLILVSICCAYQFWFHRFLYFTIIFS